MNFWRRYRVLLVIVIGLALSPFVFHFSLFDGIHEGEIKGVVKKTYYKTYGGPRGASSLRKAKLMITDVGLVSVICEMQCIIGSTIIVQVYRPIFFGDKIYIYENTFDKMFE
jgi:hypothetical protein